MLFGNVSDIDNTHDIEQNQSYVIVCMVMRLLLSAGCGEAKRGLV